jgi:hypothetical protein
MPSLPFDTLKLARRLEEAGFAPKQAGDTAEALAEAFGELATKADVAAVHAAVHADIAALKARFDAKLAALEAGFDAKLELLRRDMTIRLGGMLVVAVGVILAAMRYFTLHP